MTLLMASSFDKEALHRDRAKAFISSLMTAEPRVIPDSDGMQVLPNIRMLETNKIMDIVVRRNTEPFWDACINAAELSYHVAAVGTPGIGKSSSTPLLIRKLLHAGKKVVYVIRSVEKENFYYEFIPGTNLEVDVNLYPETSPVSCIGSLWSNSTFYIVDPGEYGGNCDTCPDFEAKVIIVTSPDEKHYGGYSQFVKYRNGVSGVFKYYPMWSLEELLAARSFICNSMSSAEVEEGYRIFGGVPRNVFFKHTWDTVRVLQENSINAITFEQARKIALGEITATGTFQENAPKSAVMGYVSPNENKTLFDKGVSVIISNHVAEKVWVKFMDDLWSYMFSWGAKGCKIFEAYCRFLMATECKQNFGYRVNGQGDNEESINLGACKKICLVVDPVIKDMKTNSDVSNVLFHSTNQFYQLIDFFYMDENGHYHAFQVSLYETHSANPDHIKELETAVGGYSNLSLYYLIPSDNYVKFKTTSVNPHLSGVQCNIYIVMVKPPNMSGHARIKNSTS